MGTPSDAPRSTVGARSGATSERADHMQALLKDAVDASDLDARVVREGARARLFAHGASPRIGRFRVLSQVGEGGMGRVYAAYDEQLDRRVAVKVLHREVDAHGRARVEREAKAMAKLAHPNVVQVYEVGDTEGQVYIAMEFVAGQTLDAWLQAADRGWREVLGVYRHAGEGLAAAHAVGMIHRDFKPQNTMVETLESGQRRVRVLDFGLARLIDALPSTDDRPTRDDGATSSQGKLTATGKLLGTPAYMAPEQFETADVGEAADQFSFCVALWEGLFGERPFKAASPSAMYAVLTDGRKPTPPRSTAVPGWVLRAVQRGLAVHPDDRWPSLRALLQALGKDPAVRRGRQLALGAVATALAVAGIGAQAWLTTRAKRCSGAIAQLQGVWDAAVRGRVQAAIVDAQAPFAGRVWERTATRLDAYADAWTTMHTETCAATTLRQEQSIEAMDLRMECLHRARVQLGATAKVLAHADAKVVARAHHVVDGLPDLARCADVAGLRAGHEPPSKADQGAVQAARGLLAEAMASEDAGRYAEAEAKIEEAKQSLVGVDYEPVRIAVALREGSVLDRLGRHEDAEAVLTGALELATETRQIDDMQRAAAHLMYVVGAGHKRPDEALSRYRLLAEHLARSQSPAQAQFFDHLGTLQRVQNNFVEAATHHRRALELKEAQLGVGHSATAIPRANLANALGRQGKLDEAAAQYRIVVAIEEEALGPQHPAVARSLVNLGPVLHAQGKLAEAEAVYRRGLAILLAAVGPAHTDVASARNNLGVILSAQGKHAEAETLHRSVLALRQRLLAPDHPDLATSHNNLAIVLRDLGQDEEALAQTRRAMILWEKALGPDHPRLATAQNNRANSLSALGRYEEAEAAARRALEILEAKLGPEHRSVAGTRGTLAIQLAEQGRYADAEVEFRRSLSLWIGAHDADHPLVAMARHNLARFLVDRGRGEDALDIAEQAWARRQRNDIRPGNRAETAFVLAQALWMVQPDARARARGLAQDALKIYAQADATSGEDAQTIRAWLRERPEPK